MTLTEDYIRSLLEIKDPNIKLIIFYSLIHSTNVRIIKSSELLPFIQLGSMSLVHNGHTLMVKTLLASIYFNIFRTKSKIIMKLQDNRTNDENKKVVSSLILDTTFIAYVNRI